MSYSQDICENCGHDKNDLFDMQDDSCGCSCHVGGKLPAGAAVIVPSERVIIRIEEEDNDN